MSQGPSHDVYEALSRLLSGELPEPEAAALRERIEREPAVAAAWEAMRALPGELEALPDLAPPPELDDAVLGVGVGQSLRGKRGERRWVKGAIFAVAALAAAAILFVGFPEPEERPVDVQLVLADGSQWVDGHALVIAGDQVVEVEGSARITVEPPRSDVRVLGVDAEDAMQRRDVLVGALAGAVVTVAVYEGSARMWPAAKAEAEAVSIAAGESKTVGLARTPRGLEVKRGEAPAGESPQQTIARLTQERDELARALEQSRFEGAMARGQLAVHQGEPIPWDDSVPEAHRPEAVRAGVDAFLEAHPEVELADLDCAEFPCIATFQPAPTFEGDVMSELRELPKDYAMSLFGEGSAVMASVAAHEGEHGVKNQLISVAAVPGEQRDGDWATRAQYRTDALTRSFVEGAMEEGSHDVDIE